MRHNKKFNHLGRKKAHRDALLSNQACSLILHKRIFTTVAKAKALRTFVEPIITKSKEDNTANRRLAFSYLKQKDVVKELFGIVSEKVADRPGGYCRILKTGHRLGDNAEMCMIELVDFNELALEGAGKKKAKKTRRSRKKADAPKAEAPAEEAPKAEATAEEAPKAEAPAEEAPKAEAPAEEAPAAEEPKAE